MSNIKQYFKDIFRTTSVLFISFLLTIWLVAFAITYPTTPTWQTAWGKFQEYFNKIFTGSCPTWQAIAGYDTNKDPICITTGTGSSGGWGWTWWKNVALTDTNNFDVNCDYRVDLWDGNTSWAKYRNVTGISNGSILIWYNQVTGWIWDSISKNSKSATTGWRSVTSIDKKCWLWLGLFFRLKIQIVSLN